MQRQTRHVDNNIEGRNYLDFGVAFFTGEGGHKNILFLCLNAEKNSVPALMLIPSGLNIIKYFLLRQRRHIPATGLNSWDLMSCLDFKE